MTTDRFSPADIFLAHLKGLKNRNYTTARPVGVADISARVALYAIPVAAGVAMYWFDGIIASGDGILAAAGILTGAFFMGFTQVVVWRERFTERRSTHEQSEVHQRDSLDEAIAHILMAMYASMLLIVAVIVSQNLADKDGNLVGVPAAAIVTLGAYVLLIVAIILPKLYTAYASINDLDDEMSGLSH